MNERFGSSAGNKGFQASDANDCSVYVAKNADVITWSIQTLNPVSLPDLSTARWRYAPESPEAQPGFDDSSWQVADKTQTNSTTKPPAGQPVLTAWLCAKWPARCACLSSGSSWPC